MDSTVNVTSDLYFDFELNYRPDEWRRWSYNPINQWLGVPIAVVYVLAVFYLQFIMEKRQRFELNGLLIIWNFALSIFSWLGSTRMVPFWWNEVSKNGIDFTLCDDFVYRNPPTSFWICAFVFSKILELCDTVFIILRKQKLIFLHWYHHATVVIFAFANWYAWPGVGLWQTTMNFSVHSLMYTYYMVRALRFRPPQFISKTITTLQIIQMVIACILGTRTFYFIISGQGCGTDNLRTSGLALFFYLTYLVLFANFFWKTYIVPRSREKAE